MVASIALALGKKVRLVYQDEARFGRLPVIRRAWCPHGFRPKIKAAITRQFKYIYGAVDVMYGTLCHMTFDQMNTENMGVFLDYVSKQYPDDIILMVLDGASSHTTGKLRVPENMHLQTLPPYSPELNPVEQLWRHLRTHVCGNRYFNTLQEVVQTVEVELEALKKVPQKVVNMFYWPSIQEASKAS